MQGAKLRVCMQKGVEERHKRREGGSEKETEMDGNNYADR